MRVRRAGQAVDDGERLARVAFGGVEATGGALDLSEVVEVEHGLVAALLAELLVDGDGFLGGGDADIEVAGVEEHEAEVVERGGQFLARGAGRGAQEAHGFHGIGAGGVEVLGLHALGVGEGGQGLRPEHHVERGGCRIACAVGHHHGVRAPLRVGERGGVLDAEAGFERLALRDRGHRFHAGAILRHGIVHAADAGECIAERLADLGGLERRVAERATLQVARGGLELLAHGDVVAAFLGGGVRARKHAGHVLQHVCVLLRAALGVGAGELGDVCLLCRIRRGADEHRNHRGHRAHRHAVTPHEPPRAAELRGPCRRRRVAVEPAHEVGAEVAHRLVALGGVGSHRAQRDGVEVRVDGPHLGRKARGCRRRVVADGSGEPGAAAGAQHVRIARQAAGEQFVEHHAQAEDIAARVRRRGIGLLGGHVLGRAHECALHGAGARVAERRIGHARDTEVDDARADGTVVVGDQDVGGLQVAVDHAAAVRVLHGVADAHHELDARPHRERARAHEIRHRQARHVRHGEPRTAVGALAGVEHAGDARMVERRDRLLLRHEAGVRGRRSQRVAQHLDGHQAAHRLFLATEEHLAEAALAEGMEQHVASRAAGARGECLAELRAQGAHRRVHAAGGGFVRREHASGGGAFLVGGIARREQLCALGLGHAERIDEHVLDDGRARRCACGLRCRVLHRSTAV